MPASPIYILKMFFGGQGQGWSEVYCLSSGSLATARTDAAALVTARLAMLAASIECVYSNITQVGVKRKAYCVTNAVTPGALAVPAGNPNKVSDTLLYRQESADGSHANRHLHAPPDAAVVNNDYFPTGNAAFDTALAAFLALIPTKTALFYKDPATTPPTPSTKSITSVLGRGVSEHKVGRAFDERRGKRRTA